MKRIIYLNGPKVHVYSSTTSGWDVDWRIFNLKDFDWEEHMPFKIRSPEEGEQGNFVVGPEDQLARVRKLVSRYGLDP